MTHKNKPLARLQIHFLINPKKILILKSSKFESSFTFDFVEIGK